MPLDINFGFKKSSTSFLHPKVHSYFKWLPRKFICNHTRSTCVTEFQKRWFIRMKTGDVFDGFNENCVQRAQRDETLA